MNPGDRPCGGARNAQRCRVTRTWGCMRHTLSMRWQWRCRDVARSYALDAATRHEYRATAGRGALGRLAYRVRRRFRPRTPGTCNRGRNQALNPLWMQRWSSVLACLHAHPGGRRRWERLSVSVGRAGKRDLRMHGMRSRQRLPRMSGTGVFVCCACSHFQPLCAINRQQTGAAAIRNRHVSLSTAALAPSSAWRPVTRSVSRA